MIILIGMWSKCLFFLPTISFISLFVLVFHLLVRLGVGVGGGAGTGVDVDVDECDELFAKFF